jgi:hypothetical protein
MNEYSDKITVESPVAELDQNKLLGFRHIAVFGSDASTLARALGAAHNKIGEEGAGSPDK